MDKQSKFVRRQSKFVRRAPIDEDQGKKFLRSQGKIALYTEVDDLDLSGQDLADVWILAEPDVSVAIELVNMRTGAKIWPWPSRFKFLDLKPKMTKESLPIGTRLSRLWPGTIHNGHVIEEGSFYPDPGGRYLTMQIDVGDVRIAQILCNTMSNYPIVEEPQ